MFLYSDETHIYITVLTGIALLGIFMTFFSFTMFRQYQAKRKLQLNLISAEIATLEKERTRIARDMHDEFSPLLNTILLQLDSLENISEEERFIVEHSEQCLQQLLISVKSIILDLEPVSLNKRGLKHALIDLESKINSSKQVACEIRCSDIPIENKQTEIHVYRIISEIAHNTLKHANAADLRLTVTTEKNKLTISASDNGKGFNFLHTLHNDRGLGLKNIINRVRFMRGVYSVHSETGKGTSYKIQIPFNGENNRSDHRR